MQNIETVIKEISGITFNTSIISFSITCKNINALTLYEVSLTTINGSFTVLANIIRMNTQVILNNTIISIINVRKINNILSILLQDSKDEIYFEYDLNNPFTFSRL